MNNKMDAELYKKAGVDLDKANTLVERIKPIAKKTIRKGVITGVGGFGALFALDTNDYSEPVLVSSTDGVGTKIKVAIMAEKFDTIGIDLVAMCVNDIITHGARPLFFLDYIAMGQIDLDILENLVSGIGKGCEIAGCALIGGETAEMPDFYKPGDFDMAGFALGVVNKDNIVDGSTIHVGDVIVGFASNGLHSNGYSLVRKIIFERLGLKINDHIGDLGVAVSEELLKPTTIYAPLVNRIIRHVDIKGMAHITGGGIIDNIPRILPGACTGIIYKNSWDIPPIFSFLQEAGGISDEEMMRVFNNGIGYVVIVNRDFVEPILQHCSAMNIRGYVIGHIDQKTDPNSPGVQFTEQS